MEVMPGTTIGKTIFVMMRQWPAPSIFALSMSESGMLSK